MGALVYHPSSYLLLWVSKNFFLALSKIFWQCSQAGWCISVTDVLYLHLCRTHHKVPWDVSGSDDPLLVRLHPKFTQFTQPQTELCSGIRVFPECASLDTRVKGILSPLCHNSSNILRRNRNPFSVKSPKKVCNMIQSHVSRISCLTSEYCLRII